MKYIRNFLSRHKHFYALGLLIPILIWFKYLEITLVPKHVIFSPLDEMIPFIKVFVIPYLIWFPYIAYGFLFTGIYSRRNFYKLFIFLTVGMTGAFIIYIIYPNAQDLRPSITLNDPLSVLVKIVYDTDTSTNVCPSIHVINSIAVNSALQHTNAFAYKKSRRYASYAMTVLICLSTVFIKQHSIIDVVCGIIMAVLIYLPLYTIPNRKAQKIYRDNRQSQQI